MDEQVIGETESPENRAGIFIIGTPNVGKRTLLSPDVSLWMTHLHEDFYIEALPFFDQLAALVMVFDINESSSFVALKEWVARTWRLQKVAESWGNSNNSQEFSGYGISKTEGSSLLGDEESPLDMKNSCLQRCIEHNIDFDKCLSVDGDSQGVERIYEALSAHMWPGTNLLYPKMKSRQKRNRIMKSSMNSCLQVQQTHLMMTQLNHGLLQTLLSHHPQTKWNQLHEILMYPL